MMSLVLTTGCLGNEENNVAGNGEIEFSLGGFQHFSAYAPDQFNGNYLLYSWLTYLRDMPEMNLPSLRSTVLRTSLEFGDVWQTRSSFGTCLFKKSVRDIYLWQYFSGAALLWSGSGAAWHLEPISAIRSGVLKAAGVGCLASAGGSPKNSSTLLITGRCLGHCRRTSCVHCSPVLPHAHPSRSLVGIRSISGWSTHPRWRSPQGSGSRSCGQLLVPGGQSINLMHASQRHPAVMEVFAARALGLQNRPYRRILDPKRFIFFHLHVLRYFWNTCSLS